MGGASDGASPSWRHLEAGPAVVCGACGGGIAASDGRLHHPKNGTRCHECGAEEARPTVGGERSRHTHVRADDLDRHLDRLLDDEAQLAELVEREELRHG